MGCDARAILYYGVQLGNEDPMSGRENINYYDDANTDWNQLMGPKQPKDDSNYRSPAWDKWREELKVYKDCPVYVEIASSGSDGEQTYYVHCPCLEKSVEWSEQLDLGCGGILHPNLEADAYIKEFCDKFGIEYKTPTWHLASAYL